jgi:hypothetical protein
MTPAGARTVFVATGEGVPQLRDAVHSQRRVGIPSQHLWSALTR